MLEVFRIGKSEEGHDRPKRLKQFNLDGLITVAVAPEDDLDVRIGNGNFDGTTSIYAISIDGAHHKTEIVEHTVMTRIKLGAQEENAPVQHAYDHNCQQCTSGEGHIIKVDDIASGERNVMILRIMPWHALFPQVMNDSKKALSRFE